ncbi:MAG TPA: hypothetical protein VGQ52_13905 [Gemmatimonadaceae bacterium]|jgi:hypothetical protein|nr:hypothetical protein [Gemmatimonadaceae bacterium]
MNQDTTPKLTTADAALLKAAATGEGLIELTPALLDDISRSLDERQRQLDEDYPKLVAACPYETRLAVACWVVKSIVDHARDGGTYRYLIYERLGFGPDAYAPMQMSGALTISNEFDLSEPAAPPSALRSLVARQAEDAGLWFDAVTAGEAYLQQELRKLHAAVEGEEIGRPSP